MRKVSGQSSTSAAEAEVMRVTAIHEADWKKVMAEASKDSWKDEA